MRTHRFHHLIWVWLFLFYILFFVYLDYLFQGSLFMNFFFSVSIVHRALFMSYEDILNWFFWITTVSTIPIIWLIFIREFRSYLHLFFNFFNEKFKVHDLILVGMDINHLTKWFCLTQLLMSTSFHNTKLRLTIWIWDLPIGWRFLFSLLILFAFFYRDLRNVVWFLFSQT